MGIDVSVFNFLLRYRGRGLGRTLCLGRQAFNLPPDSNVRGIANELLKSIDETLSIHDVEGDNGYSEKFFNFLGSSAVLSMDMSDFEGAKIIHDLNKPIPNFMENFCDTIFDGGTLEHIYNFPMASMNIRRMLRVGGLFLSVNAANNQLGHGLYQFSPELLWRAFGPEVGFDIEVMELVPITGAAPKPIPVSAPDGRRLEIGPTQNPTYVMCAARKMANYDIADITIYQGDYAAAWKRARNAKL